MPVERAEPQLHELMALDINHGSDLQLDPLLQAVAGQLRDQLPSGTAVE